MFAHLLNYSSYGNKQLLKEIDSFDLIVLMGDELENSNATPFKKDAPTKCVYSALTETNWNLPLKRKPLLLEGGKCKRIFARDTTNLVCFRKYKKQH